MKSIIKLHIIMYTLLRMICFICITLLAIKMRNGWYCLWYLLPTLMELEVNIPPDIDKENKK